MEKQIITIERVVNRKSGKKGNDVNMFTIGLADFLQLKQSKQFFISIRLMYKSLIDTLKIQCSLNIIIILC